jgi:predicted nucleic acid-binding protein
MNADFLDSNVLLYLASSDDRKALVAEGLLRDTPTISAQVLNESASVLRRKFQFDWPEVDRFVERIVLLTKVLSVSGETNRSARRLSARYGFAFYDSVIVASALEGYCTRLWSEDLQHGQTISALTIVNPFR